MPSHHTQRGAAHLPAAGVALPASLPAVALLALAAVPGFAVKQLVNVVQLRTAAQQLVQFDKQGRQAKE